MNLKYVKILSKFIRTIRDLKEITPYEYVQELTETRKYFPEGNEIELFLSFLKHDKFICAVADGFVRNLKLNMASKFSLSILIFIIIFDLNEENLVETQTVLQAIKNPNTVKLLSYFTDENYLISVAQDGCKLFENEYVLQKIINPLLNNAYLLEYMIDVIKHNKKRSKKPPTIPDKLQVLERVLKLPQAPANTPLPSSVDVIPPPAEVPQTTYVGDRYIKAQLQKKYEENKYKAAKLLEVAKKLAPKTSCYKKRESVESLTQIAPFKANKAPPRKDVPLRSNFTTVIREAALFIKDQESEIKRIESIIQGGFNSEKYKQIELDYRKAREEEMFADIEKKKLKCLITREEAILAKKNVLKMNREKTLEYHRQRRKLLQDIDIWKKEEAKRIKEQVEKVHELEESAKEAGKKLIESKQSIARLAKYESKKLQEQVLQEQQDELARKVELIKEIRTLHQVRSVNIKEYDPTECPNLGLLCEMSIAELQERLVLLAVKMNQELEDKKRKIASEKNRHKEYVEDAKVFIAQSRELKNQGKLEPCGDSVAAAGNINVNSEIIDLRNRLNRMRELRQKE